jgi:hypothetical protein
LIHRLVRQIMLRSQCCYCLFVACNHYSETDSL